MTQPTTTDPALLAPGRVLAGFALSDEITSLLTGYLDDLVETLPALRVRRGFFGGAWRIGAHREGFGSSADTATGTATEGAEREHRPRVSRIDFEVSVDGERERVDMTARTTIRGRDRRPERFATRMDDAGRAALRAWIEAELLRFADRYITERHTEGQPRSA
ncbi:MAG: hypothetical protein ACYTCU_06930 [Planctomycetota bacterium]|jgi:hypothetical protein